jgi:hypothetical protein
MEEEEEKKIQGIKRRERRRGASHSSFESFIH